LFTVSVFWKREKETPCIISSRTELDHQTLSNIRLKKYRFSKLPPKITGLPGTEEIST